MLAGEIDERLLPPPVEVPHPRPSKEETRTSPKSTTEGVEYIIECYLCCRMMYRSTEETQEGRALKEFRSKSWFRSGRGVAKVVGKGLVLWQR